MPIKIQDSLPAQKILENENIFVMTEYRAMHQDIRPRTSESYATERGYRTSASALPFQYTAAGGCGVYADEQL